MPQSISRSRFILLSSASAAAAIASIGAPAKAAQFEYKLSHGTPTTFSLHIRLSDMADAIRAETNGQLDIKLFPNNVLGNELQQLAQMRSGAIQMLVTEGVAVAGVVPAIPLDGVGFAFRDAKQAEGAYDGPLGANLRKEMATKQVFGFPKVFNLGMRVVTNSSHPINSAADFTGLKMRTPASDIVTDLFRTLGASPTPIVFTELYPSLQTHVVDGQETPYSTIEFAKFYEVQKYLSVTNHMATIFWMLGNLEAINALPANLQSVMLKHAGIAAVKQRRDIELQALQLSVQLRAQGLTFNTKPDIASMRAKLSPYYARWKKELGTTSWSLLEQTSGKLG